MQDKAISPKEQVIASEHRKERDFWLNQFSGEWIKSNFYYDIKPTPGSPGNFKTGHFCFTGEIFEKICQLSNQSNYKIHMVLAAGLVVLIKKYTHNKDILIGVPAYKQDRDVKFLNTVLVLRNPVHDMMTFKELLLQLRQTIAKAAEHVNYPIEMLPQHLNLPFPQDDDFPLFDISILLENIHDKKYIRHIKHNVTFSLIKKEDRLEGVMEYNASRYFQETGQQIITHFTRIFHQALSDVKVKISQIEFLSDEDKRQLLYELNDTEARYPQDKTIHRLFEDQVERTPKKIAAVSPIDSTNIFKDTYCFKKNPYMYEADPDFSHYLDNSGAPGKVNLKLLKTCNHNCVVVNHNMLKLIDLFDGKTSLRNLFSRLSDLKDITFIMYPIKTNDLLEITHDLNHPADILSNMRFVDFILLVKLLYKNNIIELAATQSSPDTYKRLSREDLDSHELFDGLAGLNELFHTAENEKLSGTDVLLLGDTPGMPSTGLLYLGSYLQRNRVKACCRFYDAASDYQTMKKEINDLLDKTQPAIVAFSLKWFPYIARVLDMCDIVRAYSGKNSIPVKIVVGGNTAAYYWQDLIKYDCIDYIIRGDGELPLLKICRGESEAHIPNCVYKKDKEIFQNPVTYVKDETNSSVIYLSHLDEIMLSNKKSLLGTFFIYTHLGCGMNCFYCGGCRQAQQKAFGRKRVFIRPLQEVRKDITETLPYASTFQFDFDVAHKDLVEYCKSIWAGIELSGHFCLLNSLEAPSPALIELAAKTFKYVYWDLDVLTLSERHRKQLESLKLVKPQLSDEEILSVLKACDAYDNVEVRLNLINGLPYFTLEDIDIAGKLLDTIMTDYQSFSQLHWARLHAQPGTPILENVGKYDMHSFAISFTEFLDYSKKNFHNQSLHQQLEHLNYPYIYFNDGSLNSKLSLHYSTTNKKVQEYQDRKQTRQMPADALNYEQLNDKANRLAQLLRARGSTADSVIGLMLPPSIHIPAAILGVLKAGGGYLPIDPQNPAERARLMLADSNAKILVKTRTRAKQDERGINFAGETIFLDPGDVTGYANTAEMTSSTPTCPVNPANLAYIIYTSGSSGKPKGVMLTHENLVNYVHWFTGEAHLTDRDKTMLTSSFAFDLGYTSLYPSLLAGGECHIISREIYMSPPRLLNYLQQKGITFIKVTPSLLKPMVNDPGFSMQSCKKLRLIVVGGEPIDTGDIETARSICTHMEIMNHYGPTEATIGCVARYIDFNRFEDYKQNPTIGKPVYNTGVYIVEKGLNLQPIGVPGELCISGDCLARGYLNRPELTAERFIRAVINHSSLVNRRSLKANNQCPMTNDRSSHSPISPFPHFPIYLTGDLARWLPDGNIEFLGRIDKQVKIRGFRVELEEIKNQLLKHRQIKEAFVTASERKDKANSKYLCAYFVTGKKEIEIPGKNKKIYSLQEIEKEENLQDLVQDHPVFEQDMPRSITGCFHKQVKQFHDKIIIRDNGKTWTYGAFNDYVNRIAHSILEKYDDRYKLSKNERVRYKRQMLLYGWGQAAQEKLKSTTVFAAGAGGGGAPTITQLALLGIGTIKICDFDVVELSNLNRQFLHDETRIGMNKALSAKQFVNQINPNIQVIPIKEKITENNVFELVGDAAIIFDMLDGPADKFILSQCAVVRQIPHVIIAMADMNAYTTILHTPHTPCYHCIFDKEKLAAITAGMKHVVENYRKNPLAVAATSLFISTGVAVNEAVKIFLGFEKPAYNRFFYFNHRGAAGNFVDTHSYRSMTHLFSEHFKNICKDQGFDWDIGWRGHFLEELEIIPDPNCPICGEKDQNKPLTLDRHMKKQTAAMPVSQPQQHQWQKKTGKHQCQTVALMPEDDNLYNAAAITAILKAGKTYVPLSPDLPETRLCQILEQSEARLIITGKKQRERIEILIDKVHAGIPVIDVSEIAAALNTGLKQGNPTVEIAPEDTAYILFPPTSTPQPEQEGIKQSHQDVYHFLRRYTDYLPSLSLSPYDYELKTPMIGLLAWLLNIGSKPITNRDESAAVEKEPEGNAYWPARLRDFLSTKLPGYMIPSHFVQLEKIPLTPNGKIDHKALPAPTTPMAAEKHSPPQDETEKKLVRIWSEILEIEKKKIGRRHNFFELGGNSLNIIMLVSKIYKEFGFEIPIDKIFDKPTISEIALFIRSKNMAGDSIGIPLENRSSRGTIFCFPPQTGYGLSYTFLPSVFKEYSFYSFNFIEDEDRLSKYVEAIIRQQPKGPYVFFGYSAAGRLTLEVTKALEKRGHEVSDIIFADCYLLNKEIFEYPELLKREYQRLAEVTLAERGASFLKEQIIAKSGKYMEYCANTPHLEIINANIHLIVSQEAREGNADIKCWDKFTTKISRAYRGFGKHLTLFEPGYVEKNAEIISRILNKIEFNSRQDVKSLNLMEVDDEFY